MKFEPICYDHAARLIGKRPWEISRSAVLLTSAQQAALDLYGGTGCIVGMDIYNIEVEAYGCPIPEPKGNGVPVAGEPIFSEIDEMLDLELDPARDGRMPMILEAASMLVRNNPGVELRIPLSGPFTIACHLLGMENMICELFSDPEETEAALLHLAGNQLKYARAAQDIGVAVSIFESSVSPPLISPQLFSERVLPSLKKVIDGISSRTQLIIGGNTLPIAGAMCSSGASYIICPVETNQQVFIAEVGGSQGIDIRINMNPSVFLPGNGEAALQEAKRVLNISEGYENTSIGSLIPFEADSEILHEVSRFVEKN